MKSHEKVAVSGPGRDEDREMQLKKNPKVHGSRWILPPLSRRDRMILSAWEVVNTPIKLSQTHIIDILPGFQTEAGESLTKTWIGLWITTSLQLSPAPRIPGSTHSSATWTCTVVASQDPCMGETPPGHSGGVWGSSRFKPLKPLSCPLPPPQLWLRAAHITGLRRVPWWFPSAAVPAGHWHRCLSAAPSYRWPGRKLPHLTPPPLTCSPAKPGPNALQGPSGKTGCHPAPQAAASWVLGPQTDGLTWSLVPTLLKRVHCFLVSRSWREEVGTLKASSTSFIFLVPGEPHFDLLFVIKVHILNALLGPMWGGQVSFCF